MYELNQKLGKNTLFMGSCLSKNEWKMKQGNVSPKYTTNWDEILEIS
ncbi:DUF4113 domain-containing protein [Rickettsiales endosymbiont of Stachyamoeba lipophora]|nr:DUF4113 domain-containing protein [Rickettsiales endosymbiont of Stachyamoeba lipophora]